jgi:hypothetical protein
MPHCPKVLYENLIESNLRAKTLSQNVIILGNTLPDYRIRFSESKLMELMPNTLRVMDEMECIEWKISNKEFKSSLHSMSLHSWK